MTYFKLFLLLCSLSYIHAAAPSFNYAAGSFITGYADETISGVALWDAATGANYTTIEGGSGSWMWGFGINMAERVTSMIITNPSPNSPQQGTIYYHSYAPQSAPELISKCSFKGNVTEYSPFYFRKNTYAIIKDSLVSVDTNSGSTCTFTNLLTLPVTVPEYLCITISKDYVSYFNEELFVDLSINEETNKFAVFSQNYTSFSYTWDALKTDPETSTLFAMCSHQGNGPTDFRVFQGVRNGTNMIKWVKIDHVADPMIDSEYSPDTRYSEQFGGPLFCIAQLPGNNARDQPQCYTAEEKLVWTGPELDNAFGDSPAGEYFTMPYDPACN